MTEVRSGADPLPAAGACVAIVAGGPERELTSVADLLDRAGADVRVLEIGEGVDEKLARLQADCVVLDLRSGEVARRLLTWYATRLSHSVVVVTAAEDVVGRLHAVQVDAADHVVAPFAAREVVARVEAVVAGARRRNLVHFEIGDLVVDRQQRRAIRGGRMIGLTTRELDVLFVLMEAGGDVVSKQEMLTEVWREKRATENAVEATISSLRRKLHARGRPVIHTVHGSGYVFRVADGAAPSRMRLVAERDRLVRERDAVIARRDSLISQLRSQLDETGSIGKQASGSASPREGHEAP